MKTPLQNWVDEQIKLMQPDKVYWMDGSEEEGRRLAEIGEKETIDEHPVLQKLRDNQDTTEDPNDDNWKLFR